MVSLLWYLPITLVAFFATFVFLCAVLFLRTARDSGYLNEAPKIVLWFAYTTLLIGLLCDALLNVLLSVVFVEPPQEWLTTDRVKRLKNSGTDWQRACARWLCGILDHLDTNHCGDN